MTVSELRIGNYVSNSKGDFKTLVGDPVKISKENINWWELFIPIPLTEQWLIDFAFEKLKDCQIGYVIEHNGNEIMFLDKELYCYVNDIRAQHINYVHQLQNLYFALTGKELTK